MSENQQPEPHEVKAWDEWQLRLIEQDISLLVQQREGLTETTRYLHDLWSAAGDAADRHRLAIAVTLVAHAAVEATLNEWAHAHAADLYAKHLRDGLVSRAGAFFKRRGKQVPERVSDLSSAKNALGHSQPEHRRTGDVGTWIAGDGPRKALQVVTDVENALFDRAP